MPQAYRRIAVVPPYRVAIVYPPLEAMRQAVHKANNKIKKRNKTNIKIRDFAKKRYTWSLRCQKQVHSKTKNKLHARSPAIGQPHIVPVFGLKRPDTPGLSTLSSFQPFLANFEPIRGHTFVPRHVSYDVS